MSQYMFFGVLALGAFLIWFDGKQKTKDRNRHASKKSKTTTTIDKGWFEIISRIKPKDIPPTGGQDSCE